MSTCSSSTERPQAHASYSTSTSRNGSTTKVPVFLAACMKCVDTRMWLPFILFHDTGRRGEKSFSYTYIYHIPTKNRSNIETDGNVNSDSSQARITHLWNNEMGGQLLYELHVSRYVFLAIILQDCVSEIFPVYGRSRCPALHDTLAACGCRDSLELASGLHAKLLITHPGCCGMSPDISLTGHFTIPNNVVGEMQKGGVKTFGNPDTRETWNTHTWFKLLLPGIQVLPSFFVPVSSHILWSCSLAGLTNHKWQWGLQTQSWISQFFLVLHAPKAIISILRTTLTSLVLLAPVS